MHDVLDICRYVINYSNEKDYGISNLKLQKILYFIQAFFLTFTDKKQPCFRQNIEAWNFGPVVPEAYHEYKQYGGCDIPQIKSYVDVDDDNWSIKIIPYNDDFINYKDKRFINAVVDKFSDCTATYLVNLTHNQAPWKAAYEPNKNNIITNDSIKRYFDE